MKNTVAVLVFLGLLFFGQRGRRDATSNATVDDRGRVRQIQPGDSINPPLPSSKAFGLANTTGVSTQFVSAEALFARARERLVAEEFDSALQAYQGAINVISNQFAHGTGAGVAVELASAFEGRGNVFFAQGKPDAAVRAYENSIGIRTKLAQAGERSAPSALGRAHLHCGNAYFVIRRNDLATNHFERAASIFSEMPKSPAVRREIAMAQNCIGNVLLIQGKTEAAILKYEAAIHEWTGVQIETNDPASMELAAFRNNRGVARRLSGRMDEAATDFGAAIELLTPVTEVERGKNAKTTEDETPVWRVPRVHLDVMMGYAEKGFDISMRTRIAEKGRGKHAAIALAMAYRNRGFTQLAEGREAGAIADFRAGMEIIRKLVEPEQESDLVSQLAKSLASLAWVLAVSSDDSVRDGKAAKEFATHACELSEWRALAAVEALAAALAETGDFASAVKWQEKALGLASPAQKSEAVTRFELYKAGSPFRTAFVPNVDSRN